AGATIESTTRPMAGLVGERLVGPLGSTRNTMLGALSTLRIRAAASDLALRTMSVLLDGQGTVLVLSVDPARLRPTGGAFAAYAIVDTNRPAHIESAGTVADWVRAHPA